MTRTSNARRARRAADPRVQLAAMRHEEEDAVSHVGAVYDTLFFIVLAVCCVVGFGLVFALVIWLKRAAGYTLF